MMMTGVLLMKMQTMKFALKGLLLIPFVFYLNKGFSGGLILYSSNQAVDIKYQLIKEE